MDKKTAAVELLKAWASGDSTAKVKVKSGGEISLILAESTDDISMSKKRELWRLLNNVQTVPAQIHSDLFMVLPR